MGFQSKTKQLAFKVGSTNHKHNQKVRELDIYMHNSEAIHVVNSITCPRENAQGEKIKVRDPPI
jgi:hypothetical protein